MAPRAEVVYAGDPDWWDEYGDDVQARTTAEGWTIEANARRPGLHRIAGVREPGLVGAHSRIDIGRNSGHAAIMLAAYWGASRIILLGFDMQRTNGASHWHGDHVAPLFNPPSMSRWVDDLIVAGAALRKAGVRVINSTRTSALRCFVQMPLAEAFGLTATRLLVHGMHGLGDNLHMRALVREWMKTREVWLETPWPQVFHDLKGPRLHFVSKGSALRTQAKNVAKRAAEFEPMPKRPIDDQVTVSYPPASIRAAGSVLAGMWRTVGLTGEPGDFRLPIPRAWHAKAEAWLAKWKPTRPLMLFRPLHERAEWSGCRNRNPGHAAYAALFEAVAPEFFVVSIGDFVPAIEWPVGPELPVDVKCHAGELDFETIAALAMHSAAVFCSPGFLAVLAQAVGTPVVNVVGGYEDGRSFLAGARYTPYLAIEPIRPCPCFSHTHACDKRIDMAQAYRRLVEFVALVLPTPAPVRSSPVDLARLPTEYSNPGEIEALVELARSIGARRAVEIGCNSGRTSAALLRNVPTLERMVGVDVLPGYVTDKAAQRREVPAKPGHLAAEDPRFRLVLRARGSFDVEPGELAGCDFVFIDGDHGRAGVERDTWLARAITRPGGLIVWHDYNLTGVVDVRDVLNEYRARGHRIRHIAGTWVAYEVVTDGIQNDLPANRRASDDRRVPAPLAAG